MTLYPCLTAVKLSMVLMKNEITPKWALITITGTMLKIILIRWDFEVLCIWKLYPLFCFVWRNTNGTQNKSISWQICHFPTTEVGETVVNWRTVDHLDRFLLVCSKHVVTGREMSHAWVGLKHYWKIFPIIPGLLKADCVYSILIYFQKLCTC